MAAGIKQRESSIGAEHQCMTALRAMVRGLLYDRNERRAIGAGTRVPQTRRRRLPQRARLRGERSPPRVKPYPSWPRGLAVILKIRPISDLAFREPGNLLAWHLGLQCHFLRQRGTPLLA